MKKIFSSTVFLISQPFRFLKKISVDNFIGGVIFGALFSLVVNIITVKIQEDITRQRFFESLEREIVEHALLTSNLRDELNNVVNFTGSHYFSINLSKRYSTSVGESSEIYKYLFELDPSISGKISVYYGVLISTANKKMEKNQEIYSTASKECDPLYVQINNIEQRSAEECNSMLETVLYTNDLFSSIVTENIDEIRNDFHPTQDRLNSPWLRLLLGSKSVKILTEK